MRSARFAGWRRHLAKKIRLVGEMVVYRRCKAAGNCGSQKRQRARLIGFGATTMSLPRISRARNRQLSW